MPLAPKDQLRFGGKAGTNGKINFCKKKIKYPTPSASSVKIHFHISDYDTYFT